MAIFECLSSCLLQPDNHDSNGKESACNAGYLGLIPESGKSHGEGNVYMSTHSSILSEKSHGQRSLMGYSLWDCKKVGRDLATKLPLPPSNTTG